MQLRLNYTKAKLEWTVTDSSSSSTITYDHDSFTTSLILSKPILFIEPYIGIGHVSGSNDLTAVGTATIFDSTVTASQREGIDTKDTFFLMGIDASLLIFNIGLEYAKYFSNKRITARLSFGF
jgi:hypothetical protein